MKKLILPGFVVIAFVIYSFQERIDGSKSVAASIITKTTSTLAPSTSTARPTQVSLTTTPTAGQYKDGTYTGTVEDAVYGYIQVRATINNGKIVDIEFLQHPNDRRTSVEINTQAMPMLKQQAIQVQTAKVDGVSGATDTSQAFIQSLSAALSQATA